MGEEEKKAPQAQTQEGRRVAPRKGLSTGGKVGIALGAAAVLLVAVYLILCAVAMGDKALPGTCVGDVDVGGLTQAQAQEKLDAAVQGRYEALEIPIQVGEKTVVFSAKEAGASAYGSADQAVKAGKDNFLAAGWNYLSGLLGKKTTLDSPVQLDNKEYVAQILGQVSAAVEQPVEQPHWEINEEENTAVLYRGQTGQSVDQQKVMEDLMAALEAGEGTVTAQVTATAPDQPDFNAMKEDIDRAPADATVDPETNEIIPHKMGLTLDVDKAKEVFDALAEGESGAVELATQEPEITTLELRASLYRDVLGEGSSKITGNANRVNNVVLAAKACNGKVLLPGEQMSYNQTTGQRTSAKGYKPASGYTARGIEDMVGGGVCQPSSTLYLACLNADLEIVNRKNHMYSVSYMPDGMDATVSWPNLDYVFANNTPYPIKVEMVVENGMLVCRIYGTKTSDNYVKMESVRLETYPAGVRYQADETIPQGTTKVLQAAHTGKKVQVYKNIYAGDGTRISRTLISTDTYRSGDKVIAYNPLDGAPDGSVPPAQPSVDPTTGWAIDPATGWPIDPATGLPVEPTTPPSVSPDPAASAGPDPSGGQPATEPPAVTPGPEPGGEVTPPPAPTGGETPDLPAVPTPAPAPDVPQGIPVE